MFSALPALTKPLATSNVITLSAITSSDYDALVDFHRYARVITDLPVLRDYTLAAVAGRYYEKLWAKHFETPTATAIKAQIDNQIVGFVRFEPIAAPTEKQLLVYGPHAWGELHQLYTDPSIHGLGIGPTLFKTAVQGLEKNGCQHMLINVLAGNQRARHFYEKNGAVLAHKLVEHNERNGIVFDVPSVLYVRPLNARQTGASWGVPKP